ncbi:hypothetical protein [Streptomyces alboflavus]|uniref:hypothetical protein n=1 Tax=Streptomyces alboflavus TaxID=67267 RepID=UPI000F657652|nr:hypothetical protein [Streptomyces alboflavus]
MFPNLDDVPAIIASRPTDPEQYAPLLVDPANARVVRADEVRCGDTILAAVNERAGGFDVDWFNEEYTADPKPFDPTCECGVCCLADAADGAHVVLFDGSTSYGPWETCDPWPVSRRVLIIPA